MIGNRASWRASHDLSTWSEPAWPTTNDEFKTLLINANTPTTSSTSHSLRRVSRTEDTETTATLSATVSSTMKLSLTISCLALLAVSTNGQVSSQPECKNLTDLVLDANPEILPAAIAFNEQIAGTLQSNCLDSSGALTPCELTLGSSDVGDNYTRECNAGNGSMWVYRYSPLCDNDVFQSIDGVFVCASMMCNSTGVANLIPDPVFLVPFEEYNYTCGTSFNDLRRSSGAHSMSIVSVAAVIGIVSAYFAM